MLEPVPGWEAASLPCPSPSSLPGCCLNFKATKGHMAWSIFSASLPGWRRCFESPWPFSPPPQGNFHLFQNPTIKRSLFPLCFSSLSFFFLPLSLSAKNMQPTREGRQGELPKFSTSPGLEKLSEGDAGAPSRLLGRSCPRRSFSRAGGQGFSPAVLRVCVGDSEVWGQSPVGPA